MAASAFTGIVSACAASTSKSNVLVASAANFAEPLAVLTDVYSAATNCHAEVATGSTGKLYAQILSGAPFDVFLAADQRRPALLAEQGFIAARPKTYAVGQLALWSADAARIPADGARFLREGAIRNVALANPDLAPYGMAARQTLESLEAWEGLAGKTVFAENIGQVHAFIATGNAEAGFVARSQLASATPSGSRWNVPAGLHESIRQDAILLPRGAQNPAAVSFFEFLTTPAARDVIERFGYAVN